MSIERLIAEIDAEIARFEQARTLLAGSQGRATTAPAKKLVKRKLSAAARARIAVAQRKRWAATKGAVKAAAAKPEKKAAAPAKKRRMSAESKKRIAAAQKKRWAAIKAKKATPAKKVVKTAPTKKVAPKKAPAKAVQPVEPGTTQQ
jgi:hypothetical protein